MQTFQNYQKPTVVTEAYVDFVDQLVARRHELGLTQERLAMNIGCTTSLIHKWEQYKRVPSGFMLTCWLDALALKIEVRPLDFE
jgi:DNA-binding transcriptional regulator YiaG|tara:strand:- start:731 stop:982 length:252 start_codon:yes stop_codon:yes gene_type:complete